MGDPIEVCPTCTTTRVAWRNLAGAPVFDCGCAGAIAGAKNLTGEEIEGVPLLTSHDPETAPRLDLGGITLEELRRNLPKIHALLRGGRICRVCGCTDSSPCPGGCAWVETDLCSRCSPEIPGEVVHLHVAIPPGYQAVGYGDRWTISPSEPDPPSVDDLAPVGVDVIRLRAAVFQACTGLVPTPCYPSAAAEWWPRALQDLRELAEVGAKVQRFPSHPPEVSDLHQRLRRLRQALADDGTEREAEVSAPVRMVGRWLQPGRDDRRALACLAELGLGWFLSTSDPGGYPPSARWWCHLGPDFAGGQEIPPVPEHQQVHGEGPTPLSAVLQVVRLIEEHREVSP